MRIAAALCLGIVATSCTLAGPGPALTPAAGATTAPIQVASAARITPPPVTPPTPPGNGLPFFRCADASGGIAGSANVTFIWVTEEIGYDRFVLQFDSKVPAYTVKRQAKPTFKSSASGQPISLSGSTGVLVQVHSATGATTYSGPTDFVHAQFSVLNEARLIDDFEGYVSWGLGLSHPACFRAFTLSDPPRLVVDFTAPSS
jgi:hypothetical protein